jgi:hypothetical protein
MKSARAYPILFSVVIQQNIAIVHILDRQHINNLCAYALLSERTSLDLIQKKIEQTF